MGRLGVAGSLVTGPGNGVLRPSFRGMCLPHHVAFLRSAPRAQAGRQKAWQQWPGLSWPAWTPARLLGHLQRLGMLEKEVEGQLGRVVGLGARGRPSSQS